LVLDWLPDASLAGIDLFYPDPWPKKKHWKRRFVSPVNLDRFARVLKAGGTFRFASDIDTYVNWTLLHCAAHGGFAWEAAQADDWRKAYPGWPGTRYESKALREERTPAYLTFRRT
jgi:tRNA (guanine-N7-)-methyltransferase